MKTWLSQEREKLSKWNIKHFSLFRKCFLSNAKQTSKNAAGTIFSPEVALYLHKSPMWPCPFWKCYINCKNVCRTVSLSLAASLEPLAHCWKVGSLSLFYRYYFGRFSSKLAQVVPLPYSRGSSTLYSDGLHYFSVNIPRCYKDVYKNSFFRDTARLWNSLSIKCFLLTYDPNGYKSRIDRHLFICRFVLNRFLACVL